MNANQINEKTKNILQDYASFIGLPSGWETTLSLNDFLMVRKFAFEELSNKVFDNGKEIFIPTNINKTIETNVVSSVLPKTSNVQQVLVSNTRNDNEQNNNIIVQQEENTNTTNLPFDDEEETIELSKEERELALFTLLKD